MKNFIFHLGGSLFRNGKAHCFAMERLIVSQWKGSASLGVWWYGFNSGIVEDFL